MCSLQASANDGAAEKPLASDNAALAGVIVAIAAGSSGDTFFINGAPGMATRAITAASLDGGESIAQFPALSPISLAVLALLLASGALLTLARWRAGCRWPHSPR